MIEDMKQWLEALESYHGYMEPLTTVFGGPRVPAEQSTTGKVEKAITSLRQAIAELESQEPVIDKSAATRIATSLGWSPQRTWVGLTDEEIIDVIYPLVMADMPDDATDYEIAKAIEAKLKEKNT